MYFPPGRSFILISTSSHQTFVLHYHASVLYVSVIETTSIIPVPRVPMKYILPAPASLTSHHPLTVDHTFPHTRPFQRTIHQVIFTRAHTRDITVSNRGLDDRWRVDAE